MKAKAKDEGRRPSEQEERSTAKNEVHMIPTRQLDGRLLERINDFEPLPPPHRTISICQRTVDDRRPNIYYVDMLEVGRKGLARSGSHMMETTVWTGVLCNWEVP